VLPSRKDAGLAGVRVICVDDFTALIAQDVVREGIAARAAISEQYPLLRRTQFLLCGYKKKPIVTETISHAVRTETASPAIAIIEDK
jgi:hypothetical protein